MTHLNRLILGGCRLCAVHIVSCRLRALSLSVFLSERAHTHAFVCRVFAIGKYEYEKKNRRNETSERTNESNGKEDEKKKRKQNLYK